MEKAISAVGFSMDSKQSGMIESKLKRIAYAEDKIVTLTMKVKLFIPFLVSFAITTVPGKK